VRRFAVRLCRQCSSHTMRVWHINTQTFTKIEANKQQVNAEIFFLPNLRIEDISL
jgi:hypothetical protein